MATFKFSPEGQRNHDRCVEIMNSAEFRAEIERKRRERLNAEQVLSFMPITRRPLDNPIIGTTFGDL